MNDNRLMKGWSQSQSPYCFAIQGVLYLPETREVVDNKDDDKNGNNQPSVPAALLHRIISVRIHRG